MVVFIIAVAAGIGSLIGAFFRVRLMALLWSTPILCLLYGAVVFVAPFVKDNEAAPALLRTLIVQFADISLLIPVLVAGAAGTLIASTLTRQVGESRAQTSRTRDVTDRRRREPKTAGDRLKERAQILADRPARSVLDRAAPPVHEAASTPPAPAPAESGMAPAAPPARPPAAVFPPEANRRSHGRRRSALAGELLFVDGATVGCTIQDLSVGGARVRLTGPWPQGQLWALLDHTNGLAHDAVAKWRAGPVAGLRFTASHDLQAFLDRASATPPA